MNVQIRTIQEGEDRTTTIKMDDKRNVLLTYYDFSDETRNSIGEEIAYDMTIPYESLPEVFRLLCAGNLQSDISNEQILERLEANFPGFYHFKGILESVNVKHQCERDPWP